MNTLLKSTLLAPLLALAGAGGQAYAASWSQNLLFETETRQSSWGPGDALGKSGSKNLITPWSDLSVSVGGIVGNDGIVDTRTGAEATISTSGRVGAKLDWAVDAGSVGATLGFKPQLELPDAPVAAGKLIALNANAARTSGTMDFVAPTVQASANLIFDAKVTANGKVCFAFAGCSESSNTLIKVTNDKELININAERISIAEGFLPSGVKAEVPLADATIKVKAQAGVPPRIALEVDGKTVGPALGGAVEVATINVTPPVIKGAAVLDGGVLKVRGEDEVLAIKADLDTLLPVAPPGGGSFDVGPFSLSLEAYDAKAGPVMSMYQDFELTSELMVDFTFDKAVNFGGTRYESEFTSVWNDLPDLEIFEDTEFTPTFWIDAQLKNKTGLSFALELGLEFLKGSLNIGFGDLSFGPLVTLPLVDKGFGSVSLINKAFDLAGFGRITGESFSLSMAETTAPVPLPGAFWMAALSTAGLFSLRRKRAGYASVVS